MRKLQRKFERPTRTWDKTRIEEEKKIMQSYGLRRKKELWRAESILREYRRLARELSAVKDKEKEKILLDKLFKMGLVGKDSNLDDVLALSIQSILDRRLQTIVFKKGLAKTAKEARQYIVHGHVTFEGRRAKWPSTLVHLGGEEQVSFHARSKIGVKS
jgi:small subunit ribosomal protein S4